MQSLKFTIYNLCCTNYYRKSCSSSQNRHLSLVGKRGRTAMGESRHNLPVLQSFCCMSVEHSSALLGEVISKETQVFNSNARRSGTVTVAV